MKKSFTFSYTLVDSSKLSETWSELLIVAKNAAKKSYSPYSNFRVSCAARLIDGTTTAAANQENASYPIGICAERNLLSNLEQLHVKQIQQLIVFSPDTEQILTPCGMCRQALVEFQHRFPQPFEILLMGKDKCIILKNATDLLPFTFDKSQMKD